MLQSYQGFSSPVYAESLRGQELTQTDFLEAMQKKKKKQTHNSLFSEAIYWQNYLLCSYCFCVFVLFLF